MNIDKSRFHQGFFDEVDEHLDKQRPWRLIDRSDLRARAAVVTVGVTATARTEHAFFEGGQGAASGTSAPYAMRP